jgi:hypothetical protein
VKKAVTISEGQSLVDVAVQEYGAAEMVWQLIRDNASLDLFDPVAAGTLVSIDLEKVQKPAVREYYLKRAQRINTGDTQSPFTLGKPIIHNFSTLPIHANDEKVNLDGTVRNFVGDRDGTVFPSRANKGHSLTFQIWQAAKFQGYNSLVVSYYECVSQTFKLGSAIYKATTANGNAGYEWQLPDGEFGHNIKWWPQGYIPTTEEQQRDNLVGNVVLWVSGEEGSTTTMHDMSGNKRHLAVYSAQADWNVFDGDASENSFSALLSFLNEYGYNEISAGVYKPASILNRFEDADGAVLGNVGLVRKGGKVVNAPCIILAEGEILLYPSFSTLTDLTPIYTVVCGGTATLTIDKPNRRLVATAGTCWNIRHLDINGNVLGHNIVSEGTGAILCDVTKPTSGNNYDLGSLNGAAFNFGSQNQYTYNQAVGANKDLLLYEQVNTPLVDPYFEGLVTFGVPAGDRTFTTTVGTINGRDDVQIVTLSPTATIPDWRFYTNPTFYSQISRVTAGFNVRLSFDYYATGDIAALSAFMGLNNFVGNSLGGFISNAWTPFLVETPIKGSGYFTGGSPNLIGFWISSSITTGQIAFDNFKIEIISAIPALSSGGQDILGKPLDPDAGKKMFDFGESLVYNPNRDPKQLQIGYDNTDEPYADIIDESLDHKQFSRHEPTDEPEKKSDILKYAATPTQQQINRTKKYLGL